MEKFIDSRHRQPIITKFNNRVDLDTALKRQGMAGLYGNNDKAAEQKELHAHLIKRAMQVGEQKAKQEVIKGKMFNKKDLSKI